MGIVKTTRSGVAKEAGRVGLVEGYYWRSEGDLQGYRFVPRAGN